MNTSDKNIQKIQKVEKKNQNKSFTEKKLICVGIGASAGGLEALELFFRNMPANSNLTFIVVQHLSSDYKSLMVELLSKYTPMKVVRAEDGMQIMPDCIYLIPPKKNMTIFHNKLFLTEKVSHHVLNLPIDIFFRSLAEDFAENAIGIILSGTGSDGTLGIKAIKEAGGLVIAQSDSSAKFDGMPRSAVATGMVDYVLPAEKMPDVLLQYINHPVKLKSLQQTDLPQDTNSLNKIMGIIRSRIGTDFTFYKPNTIIRRLERRISINQINSFENYVEFLEKSPNEVYTLYKELLIGVTRFFRDTEAFDIIKQQVIPNLFKQKKKNDSLRLWSVGCSTAEEAYSIAILLHEHMEQNKQFHDIKIFATDLDKDSIELGSTGYYSESIVTDVSEEILKKYFTKKEKGYQVKETIRKMIVFATHNVIKDPPFSKIDLLLCRNMLIYLNPDIQKKIISLFLFSLNKTGYLFLGPSETLGDLSIKFSTINSKWKIFTIKENASVDSSYYLLPILKDSNNQYFNQEMKPKQKPVDTNDTLYHALIDEFAPPSLVVDKNFDIIHICKDINQFIKIPTGKISYNVISLIRNELKTTIGIALNKALKQNKEVFYKNNYIEDEGEERLIDIKIKPLVLPNDDKKLFLIAFLEQNNSIVKNSGSQRLTIEYDANQQMKDIETELKSTKENLQATIEELATTNEELQSSNEELISSNEELQSTNEELQSVNEELFTVNSEYQYKIEELTQTNNDINNLLLNANIGMIFLDLRLHIRKYTPSVTEAINLLEMDIGRPIHHISHNILYTNFIEDIEQVLQTLEPIENELQGKNGNWFLMRILPYRTMENAVDGIVITFLDISQRKQFEKDIEQNANQLLSVLDNNPVASIIVDNNNIITYVNNMAQQLLGKPASEITGQKFLDAYSLTDEHGNVLADDLSPYQKIMQAQMSVFEMIYTLEKNQQEMVISINGSPFFDEKAQINGGVFTLSDITKQRNLEAKLVQEKELFFRILHNSPNAKILLDKTGKITYVNHKAMQIFNLSDAEYKSGKLNFSDLKIRIAPHLNISSELYKHIIEQAESIYNIEFFSEETDTKFFVNGYPIITDNDQVNTVVLSIDPHSP